MANFGGAAIFGRSVTMNVVAKPRAQQENEFFGLAGVESLDGGARGRVTVVTGVHLADDLPGLSALQDNFLSWHDGQVYDLVDNRGRTWTNVRLDEFQPQGRVVQTTQGQFMQQYTAKFTHLSG